MTVICGIDPGQTGAIAFIERGDLLEAVDMPAADKQVVGSEIYRLLKVWRPAVVVIERVSSMPNQGVASSFKFGKNYGVAIGAASMWPQHFMTPAKWKKHHRLTKKDANGKSDKDQSRLKAIQLWPTSELFETKARGQARADAALLALAYEEDAR